MSTTCRQSDCRPSRGLLEKRKMSLNYYELLGVRRDADSETIRAAYLRFAKWLHPDINDAPGAAEHFKLINRAYECLSEDETRFTYDMRLLVIAEGKEEIRTINQKYRTSVFAGIAAATVLIGFGITYLSYPGNDSLKVSSTLNNEYKGEQKNITAIKRASDVLSSSEKKEIDPEVIDTIDGKRPTQEQKITQTNTSKLPKKIEATSIVPGGYNLTPVRKFNAPALPKLPPSNLIPIKDFRSRSGGLPVLLSPPSPGILKVTTNKSVYKAEPTEISTAQMNGLPKNNLQIPVGAVIVPRLEEETVQEIHINDVDATQPQIAIKPPLNSNKKGSNKSVPNLAGLEKKTTEKSTSDALSRIYIKIDDNTSVPANILLKIDTRIWNWDNGKYRIKFANFVKFLVETKDVENASKQSGLSLEKIRHFAKTAATN
jgi:curved DNA-binding protein CbpA